MHLYSYTTRNMHCTKPPEVDHAWPIYDHILVNILPSIRVLSQIVFKPFVELQHLHLMPMSTEFDLILFGTVVDSLVSDRMPNVISRLNFGWLASVCSPELVGAVNQVFMFTAPASSDAPYMTS